MYHLGMIDIPDYIPVKNNKRKKAKKVIPISILEEESISQPQKK